jgi:endoglucanase
LTAHADPRAREAGCLPPGRYAWAAAAGLLLVLSVMTGCAPGVDSGWRDYLRHFVTPEGRVVDTGNANVSHSEGQGWGMLLATVHGDRAAFERIWQWTREHLALRDDRLFAWRWRPDARVPVDDLNNATDGDLYIAWALLRAHERWGERAYLDAALGILEDVRTHLVREHAGYTVLLPGATGFEHGDDLVLNLSYWIFPALRHFADADANATGVWNELVRSGERLLLQARFGRWQLPPDWLALGADGAMRPAPRFPARFGYDAVRIPLALSWSGNQRDLLQPFAALLGHYHTRKCLPAWVGLEEDVVGADAASPGAQAVLALAARHRLPRLTRGLPADADYYAASLLLLAHAAAREQSTR